MPSSCRRCSRSRSCPSRDRRPRSTARDCPRRAGRSSRSGRSPRTTRSRTCPPALITHVFLAASQTTGTGFPSSLSCCAHSAVVEHGAPTSVPSSHAPCSADSVHHNRRRRRTGRHTNRSCMRPSRSRARRFRSAGRRNGSVLGRRQSSRTHAASAHAAGRVPRLAATPSEESASPGFPAGRPRVPGRSEGADADRLACTPAPLRVSVGSRCATSREAVAISARWESGAAGALGAPGAA